MFHNKKDVKYFKQLSLSPGDRSTSLSVQIKVFETFCFSGTYIRFKQLPGGEELDCEE